MQRNSTVFFFFPCILKRLYPTIASKIVKAANEKPFQSKKEVYDCLDSDIERERLKLYDANLQINPPDKSVKQFKASQICKYECKNRVTSTYQMEQMKAVQAERMYK